MWNSKFIFVSLIVGVMVVAGKSDEIMHGAMPKDETNNGNILDEQRRSQNSDGSEKIKQNVMIFHEDQWQHQKIKVIESTYTYQQEIDPQNNKQYSIVHSLIYPNKAESERFVSSVPQDNFIKKLTQKDPSQTRVPQKQQNKQKITEQTAKTQKNIAQMQNQKEPHDINTYIGVQQAKVSQKQSYKNPPIKITDYSLKYLPELNQGQQSYSVVHRDIYPQKIQQKKFALKVTSDNFVKKMGEYKTKLEEGNKIEKSLEILKQKQKDENKAQNILKTEQIEQEGQRQEDKTQSKQQINTSGKELFDINPQSTEYPMIQNKNKKIEFKQHDFGTPKKIISYPFETQTSHDGSKQSDQSALVAQKRKQQMVPTQVNVEKKTQDKIVVPPAKLQEPQKVNPVKKMQQPAKAKPVNKMQQPLKPSSQQKVKIDQQVLDHQQSRHTSQEKSYNPQKQPQSSKQTEELEQKIVQEYQKLKKLLQIDSQQLKTHLTYEASVRSQIIDYDWNLLMTKIFVVSAILLAVLKNAFCGAQTKENPSIGTLKYAPVGSDFELQEEDFYQSRPMAFRS